MMFATLLPSRGSALHSMLVRRLNRNAHEVFRDWCFPPPRLRLTQRAGMSSRCCGRETTYTEEGVFVGEGVTFECPECGRTFGRAPALGAHRRRSHGVVGARRRRARQKMSARAGTKVDRDALLQALFPAGVPARAALLRDLDAWLSEAERLLAPSGA